MYKTRIRTEGGGRRAEEENDGYEYEQDSSWLRSLVTLVGRRTGIRAEDGGRRIEIGAAARARQPPSAALWRTSPTEGGGMHQLETDEFFFLLATESWFVLIILLGGTGALAGAGARRRSMATTRNSWSKFASG